MKNRILILAALLGSMSAVYAKHYKNTSPENTANKFMGTEGRGPEGSARTAMDPENTANTANKVMGPETRTDARSMVGTVNSSSYNPEKGGSSFNRSSNSDQIMSSDDKNSSMGG